MSPARRRRARRSASIASPRIEEVFRTLKTDGLDLEASQVTLAASLLNQAAIGIAAAVRIVQLVDARDGSSRPATDVIDAAQIPAVAAIGKSLEGATKRQRNPHRKGTLARVSWIPDQGPGRIRVRDGPSRRLEPLLSQARSEDHGGGFEEPPRTPARLCPRTAIATCVNPVAAGEGSRVCYPP